MQECPISATPSHEIVTRDPSHRRPSGPPVGDANSGTCAPPGPPTPAPPRRKASSIQQQPQPPSWWRPSGNVLHDALPSTPEVHRRPGRSSLYLYRIAHQRADRLILPAPWPFDEAALVEVGVLADLHLHVSAAAQWVPNCPPAHLRYSGTGGRQSPKVTPLMLHLRTSLLRLDTCRTKERYTSTDPKSRLPRRTSAWPIASLSVMTLLGHAVLVG